MQIFGSNREKLIGYRGGNFAPIQTFLIISTCFLYLVAAGLFSKAVWAFQMHKVGLGIRY